MSGANHSRSGTFDCRAGSRDTGFPVYHYLTLDIANHQLHAVMWKVTNPDAPALGVEQKDEFTIKAK